MSEAKPLDARRKRALLEYLLDELVDEAAEHGEPLPPAVLAVTRRGPSGCTAEGLESIAFCCISTGVFGFPQAEAAGIAVQAVRLWLDAHPDVSMTVVFNVFGEADEALYRQQLGIR